MFSRFVSCLGFNFNYYGYMDPEKCGGKVLEKILKASDFSDFKINNYNNLSQEIENII